MKKFIIDVTELYWINGDMDDPEDLCLHGHAVAYIAGEKLEYDCTVTPARGSSGQLRRGCRQQQWNP